jgi:cytochrome c-type biogenesis protein
LQSDLRIHRVPHVGLAAAPMLGIMFALGWTPCFGPTLTAVAGLAYNEGTAGRGLLLGLAYSLGLGIPFLVVGVAYERTLGLMNVARRHRARVMRLGGGMLIGVGLLLITGLWADLVATLQSWAVSLSSSDFGGI